MTDLWVIFRTFYRSLHSRTRSRRDAESTLNSERPSSCENSHTYPDRRAKKASISKVMLNFWAVWKMMARKYLQFPFQYANSK